MASNTSTGTSANAPHQRVRLFDTLRGFSVVSMVLFHFFYDLVFLIGVVPSAYFFTPAVDIWRASISWTFLIIAGIMCTFSRSNFKRAAIYCAVALAVFLVTSFIDKDVEISFGIIYCMGFCTLLAAILSAAGFKPKGIGWAIAFFVIFILLLHVPSGRLSLFGHTIVELPRGPYLSGSLSWLGFPGVDFMSADYYPPLPYLFLYLCGWSVGLMLKEKGYASPVWGASIPVLDAIGRYALPIYVLHQPMLLAICQIVAIAVGR